MDYEYACTNGVHIIGQPGTLVAAQIVLDTNYDLAHRAGDRSRYDYRIVRRQNSTLLTDRPGAWEDVELVSMEEAALQEAAVESFSLETALDHSFQWHPQSAASLMAGTTNMGSASCSCGDWSSDALDNRAGQAAARQEHANHETRALRSTVMDLAAQLGHEVDGA